LDNLAPGFISTLSIYNSSIITAFTDGKIVSTPLPTNWKKPLIHSSPYSFELQTNEEFINEMIGFKGSLFVSTSNQLLCFNIMKSPVEKNQYFMKNIVNCTHMRINYKSNLLFAISEERGLVVIDISNPLEPRYMCDIPVSFFQENNCVISDLDLYENTIFLALRNKGILRLDYYQNTVKEPLIHRSFEKIRLNDPQDVKYNKNNHYLYIADAEEGLIILNTEDNKVVHRCLLPNNDFPRKLIIHHKNCIIQGSKGLYIYNTSSKEIKTIIGFKIGAVSKYYNKILFYKNRKLNLLVLGNNTDIEDNDNFSRVYKFKNNNLSIIKE